MTEEQFGLIIGVGYLVLMIYSLLYYLGVLICWGIAYRVCPENRGFMNQSLELLKPRWGKPIAVSAIVYAISILLYGVPIVGFICLGPFLVGLYHYLLLFSRDPENTPIDVMFDHVRGWSQIKRSTGAYILLYFYRFAWSLLFIIPGIVKFYSYGLTFYILTDYPHLSANQAITRSREMMDGHKAELFWLHCRFGGWFIVSALTSGIGFLFYYPYAIIAEVNFYEKLKAEYDNRRSIN